MKGRKEELFSGEKGGDNLGDLGERRTSCRHGDISVSSQGGTGGLTSPSLSTHLFSSLLFSSLGNLNSLVEFSNGVKGGHQSMHACNGACNSCRFRGKWINPPGAGDGGLS